ncbi:protein IWS1 homolog A-like isoform X3 [Mytilus trossulus]|uniref:protein IWS1 homolog A-like isoform X3 n=1 Tax=Mytilus trossulus TaxID=6551 RepID=UPI0030052432
MTQLKKMAIKLEQEQVYEPVDTLFIVRKRGSLLYRCFGYGELCERFIKGEPLTDYPPYMNRKQKVMPEVEKDEKIEFLTPEKDLFNFGRGSGRTLAEIQKDSLDNLPVKIIPAEVNVEKPGPSKTRKIPTLHERSTIGRGRGRGGTRGKGRGRGRKRKRESSDSNDDEDRIRIEESSSDEDETRLSPLLPLESTLMRENPGPSNMSKPGPSNMSKPGPSNARKERLKKLYERSTTGRGKGRGKGRAKGRGRGMKRKRESSSDSSDSEEEIRPLDKNPRKKLFRRDIIEDSTDETDMTGLSPFLPLDSSLMNEASILIEELSFNFEKDQGDNDVEEKMEEKKQRREEKSELSGEEKEELSGKEKEELSELSGEEKEELSGKEKEELSGEEKEELSGEEKEELSGEEKEELSTEEKLEEKPKSKKNRFSVGEHVKVTFGKEDFPALVTDLDDSGVWGQFFRRKGVSGWALDEIKYFIVQKDILKSLTPPDLVPLGGSRFSYKFEDF